MSVKQYFRGASPHLECRVYNRTSHALVDAGTGVTISVYDPQENVMVNDSAMQKQATGIYYYQAYGIPATGPSGRWFWIPKVNDATVYTRDKIGYFEVMDY